LPRHVLQRGNDRQRCFFDDRDRLLYLQALREAAEREDVVVHAWVLMDNHVHLLLTPTATGAVSRMMQSIGRRYVRALNQHRKRTGTLWEGRFKSLLVDSDDHVLACYRYIELNPVRAGMVARAIDYPWSSHAANALGAEDGWIRPHPAYLALGASAQTQQARYREWLAAGTDPQELDEIRQHTAQQRCWGSEAFRAQVEAGTGQCARLRSPGRPSGRNVL
jgi:putative transposase